jgi:hypothetical protein
VPVYPVPAVVVLAGSLPVTGAATPPMGASEIVIGAVTVKENVRVADPTVLVAVIVYSIAEAIDVGVPVNSPVLVLKLIPAGAVGVIEKLVISSPVETTVKPIATELTVLVSLVEVRVKTGIDKDVAGKTAVITPELAE